MLGEVKIQPQPLRTEVVRLHGGLDLETPILQLQPGVLRDSLNFECAITGGYARIEGYERFDGQPSPSDAGYDSVMYILGGEAHINVGDTLTGNASGASGMVIEKVGDILRFTKLVGSFIAGESLQLDLVTVGMVSSVAVPSLTVDFDATAKNLAADAYRADITAPPGQGAVLGGAMLNGEVYAWRRDEGVATTMTIYKATVAGWEAVPLYYEISFTAGDTAYADGSTLTKGSVSAIVKRCIVEGGDWTTNDAIGRIIIEAPTGGNFSAGVAGGGGVVTLSGAQTAITLEATGAHVETDRWNFGREPCLYCVDGVNRAYEFNGTLVVPLKTGSSPDSPTRVCCYNDSLVLAFGTNLLYSAIGDPYLWTVLGGAGEIALGETITTMARETGNSSGATLAVHTEQRTEMFYGVLGSATMQRVTFSETAGAKAFTSQKLGLSIVLDDSGVTSLQASQNFGNFDAASLTARVRKFVEPKRNIVAGSMVVRSKSQYRILFQDGYALYLTLKNGELVGNMPIMFTHLPTCAWHGEATDGSDRIFFGASNGMVYELDKGTSFDGDDIDYFAALTWGSQGSNTVRKRYMRAFIEAQCPGYAEFTVSTEFSYRSEDIPASRKTVMQVLDGNGLVWDSGFWDMGYIWDGRAVADIRVTLEGTGENVSLTIAGASDRVAAFTLNSVTYHYIQRRERR